MAKQKTVQQAPDAVLTANFNDLLDTIFGTSEKPHDSEEIKSAIANLNPVGLISARVYISQREAQLKEVNAYLDKALAEKDSSNFTGENALYSVLDSVTQETIGGLRVETKIEKVRSTSNSRTAEKVKEELAKLGIQDQYTDTVVRLKNDVLFEAKAQNALPPSVDGLLTEEERTSRVFTYVPPKKGE